LAETGRRAAEANDLKGVAHHVNRLGEITQQALKELRLMIFELRPQTLDRRGLVGALKQRFETVEERAGIRTKLDTLDVSFSADIEDALFNIALEALNNAIKHAAAKEVSIRLDQDEERAILEVHDNGCGFSIEEAAESGGLGLEIMRERVEKLGGSLTIESNPGDGSIVRAVIPL
jgi:signal transduction histidine kinase